MAKNLKDYLRNTYSKKDLLLEGGPLAQMIPDNSVVRDIDAKAAAKAGGEANIFGRDVTSASTGKTLKEGKGYVYGGKRSTAFHEGLHLLKNRKGAWSRDAKGKRRFNEPEQIPTSEDEEGGSDDHAWMAGNELYDAKNKGQKDEAYAENDYYVDRKKMEEIAKSDMAGTEYDIGARLMFDPSRGHGAKAVAASAMAGEAFLDPRANYAKYRDAQSYLMQEVRNFNVGRAEAGK